MSTRDIGKLADFDLPDCFPRRVDIPVRGERHETIADSGDVHASSRNLDFGDVDFFEVNGIVGYRATPRFTPGLRLTYRNCEIRRAGSSFTTDDYGASLFVRYRVWKPFYLQAEYEYLSYEFIDFDFSTKRDTFGSVLAGGGVSFALSRNLGVYVTALFNFSYDRNEIRSPYSNEWIVRSGVGYSF